MNDYLADKVIGIINFLLGLFHQKKFKEIKKNHNAVKVINLYKQNSYVSNFAYTRFLDAPYIEVERIIPKSGTILDFGCGEGLFTNFLALSEPSRKLIGVDVDKRRIKEADHKLKNVKFVHGDITKKEIPPADTVIMFHLLHHLNSYNDQEELIKNVSQKLKKGGRLIIVEVKPELSLKYLTAWFTDHFLVPWLFEKRFYSNIYFRNIDDWKNILRTYGFKAKSTEASRGKPFSHVILDCEYVKR